MDHSTYTATYFIQVIGTYCVVGIREHRKVSQLGCCRQRCCVLLLAGDAAAAAMGVAHEGAEQ